MKSKRRYIWVNTSLAMAIIRLMTVTFLVLTVFCYIEYPLGWIWIAFLIATCTLFPVGAQFAIIDTVGIIVIRLFRSRISLPWECIKYCGVVNKKRYGLERKYLYFAKDKLISAPWEKMPAMHSGMVYFTDSTALYNGLMAHCKKSEVNSLIRRIKRDANVDLCSFYFLYYGVLFSLLAIYSYNIIWIVCLILLTLCIGMWVLHRALE